MPRPASLHEKPLSPGELLSHKEHRIWPPPDAAWIMAQSWGDVLFAHWPVRPDVLRPLVPGRLEIDTFDGSAWVGLVVFAVGYVRLRGLPPLPPVRSFLQANVRTYVKHGGRSGAWFFSLDANDLLAVIGARLGFLQPYYLASMSLSEQPDSIIFRTRRAYPGARDAAFSGRYSATSASYPSQPGTLAHWVTERYRLYAAAPGGRLFEGEIHHLPWPLQDAMADIDENTMAEAVHIPLPDSPPALHYARRMDMLAWPLYPLH